MRTFGVSRGVRSPSIAVESMAPQINCIHLRASLDSVSRRSSPTSFLHIRVFAIWPGSMSVVPHHRQFRKRCCQRLSIASSHLISTPKCPEPISPRVNRQGSMTITFHSDHTGAEWDARYAIEENIRLILNDQLSQHSRRGRTTLV